MPTYIDDATPATRDLMTVGDPELAESRAKLFRSQVNESRNVRKAMVEAADDIDKAVDASAFKVSDTGMLKKSMPKVLRTADDSLDAAFVKAGSEIESGVERSIARASRAQAAHLEDLGFKPIRGPEMNRLRAEAMEELADEFPPGSGMTYAKRMERIKAEHMAQTSRSVVRPRVGDAANKIKKDVQKGLTDSRPGKTMLRGGSATKKLRRVMVSEETRLANSVELKTMRTVGVSYAYWRLNPSHPWYGGKEICEWHASRTNPVTAVELASLGLDVATVDMRGLHNVGKWPDYPHPFCKCYPEAWYPPELRSAVDNLAIVASRVGYFPDELVAAGSVSAGESNAAVASLNAIAEEAGIGPVFVNADLELYGVKNSARALAQKIRSLPGRKDKTLLALRKKMSNEIPKIEARLESMQMQFQKEVERISKNTLWSDRTRRTQLLRLQERLQAEVIQNSANVESMLAVETELAAKKISKKLMTQAFGTQKNLVSRLARAGLSSDQYEVFTKAGSYWAEFTGKARSQILREMMELSPARRAKLLRIKKLEKTFSMKHSRQILDELSEGHKYKKFNLDKGQQAGALFIEEQKSVLLNFAPGIGKTPLATASVNDLYAKGKIARALISPPAKVRDQFVREIMRFSPDKAKLQLFVPKSDINKTAKSLRKAIVKELGGNKALSEAERAVIADNRLSRIDIRPVPRGAGAVDEMEKMLRSSKSRFVVMSHDDAAAFADVIPQHVDYAAIDEIHELTSAVAGEASAKAKGLQKLVGGRLKYRVGLTGTPARNNPGELHDIVNWLKPGSLPSKSEYLSAYKGITLESNALQNSLVKALRQQIDDNVFTLPSPVKAPLENFLSNPKEYLRNLQLTSSQQKRTARIEKSFQTFKDRQKALSPDSKKILEARLKEDRKDLKRILSKYKTNDIESTKLLQATTTEQAQIKKLASSIDDSNKVLHPESWRDNQHFKNLHAGTAKTNAKVKEVMRLMDGPLKDQKAIIHLERMSSIESLQKELAAKKLKVAVYSGDLDMSARSALQTAFNAGEYDVMLVTRAGSTGLNLQTVSTGTIHFDTPYTMAEYVQREARNWRRGQEKLVKSYLLHQKDHYLDRRRLDILTNKKKVLDAVDELRHLDDTVDHRLLVQTASRKELGTYEKLMKEVGRPRAEAFLNDLCLKLKLPPEEVCPYRQIPLSKKLQKQPILEASTKAQRKVILGTE